MVQMSRKFFGTSAITVIVGNRLPSWKTFTFITLVGFILGH